MSIKNITFSPQDQANNIVFQIKQLIIDLSAQKPKVDQAMELLTKGTPGVPVELIESTLGKSKEDITATLTALKAALE